MALDSTASPSSSSNSTFKPPPPVSGMDSATELTRSSNGQLPPLHVHNQLHSSSLFGSGHGLSSAYPSFSSFPPIDSPIGPAGLYWPYGIESQATSSTQHPTIVSAAHSLDPPSLLFTATQNVFNAQNPRHRNEDSQELSSFSRLPLSAPVSGSATVVSGGGGPHGLNPASHWSQTYCKSIPGSLDWPHPGNYPSALSPHYRPTPTTMDADDIYQTPYESVLDYCSSPASGPISDCGSTTTGDMTSPGMFAMDFSPSPPASGYGQLMDWSVSSAANSSMSQHSSLSSSSGRPSTTPRSYTKRKRGTVQHLVDPDTGRKISPVTGKATRQISKRTWPPKDADRRLWTCPVDGCGLTFGRPSAVHTHMRVHDGAKPYICPITTCQRPFSVFSNLKRHMVVHPSVDFTKVNVKDLEHIRCMETSEGLQLVWDDETADGDTVEGGASNARPQ